MPRSVYKREYKRLLEMLIEARRSAGLTQAQVAKRLGRHQSFVSKYERAERRIDVIEFVELARVLNLDLESALQNLHKPRAR